MLDFSIAQTEIDRLIAIFPRAPKVFLAESVRKLERLPDYLINRVKANLSYIKQAEAGDLLVNGIYCDDVQVNSEFAVKRPSTENFPEADGHVVLLLENIKDIPSLQKAFMHEVLGHYAVTRSMAQRMKDNPHAHWHLGRSISEYTLFYDHILSENRKQIMRKMYGIPSSFVARFKHSIRTRGLTGKSANPLMSVITAHLLKSDFNSLIASEIIAHSVNRYLIDHSIEDAIGLSGHDNGYGSSIWEYTIGDMFLLNMINLDDEEQVDQLIFSWMICPAMNWLMQRN